MRILIVDDNTDSGDSLGAILTLRGHTVRVAYSAHRALVVAERFSPDVILLDLGMPVMDGYAACEAFRRTDKGKRAIIIAITGWSQAEDRRRSRDAGFDEHLVKPVRLEDLLEHIQRLAADRKLKNASAASVGIPELPPKRGARTRPRS